MAASESAPEEKVPQAPQAPAAPDEAEVQARGPVHEAYAGLGEDRPAPSPVIARAPPLAVEETPPEVKPEGDVQWVPGYWAWDDERDDHVWVSGTWRVPPPGCQWLPGSWREVEGGWQW